MDIAIRHQCGDAAAVRDGALRTLQQPVSLAHRTLRPCQRCGGAVFDGVSCRVQQVMGVCEHTFQLAHEVFDVSEVRHMQFSFWYGRDG
jgi:hypothetical protein